MIHTDCIPSVSALLSYVWAYFLSLRFQSHCLSKKYCTTVLAQATSLASTKLLFPHSFHSSVLDRSARHLAASSFQHYSKNMSVIQHYYLRNKPEQELHALYQMPHLCNYFVFVTFTFFKLQKRYIQTRPLPQHFQFVTILLLFQQQPLCLRNFCFLLPQSQSTCHADPR